VPPTESIWRLLRELRARQADIEQQNEELRRTQAALRESGEQLRFLSDNLADGMVYQIDSGVDGTQRLFSYVAAAVERFHGIRAEEARREPQRIYEQVVEQDRPLVQAREARAFATRTLLDVEVRVRLPSGELRWRHFRSAPRTRADGHIVWDGIELDTTEQRRAREEHDRLQQQLAQAQKTEALGRLAGGVAHDVNNALQAITGHAELALAEADLPATVRADLEDIRKASQRSASLARQLLAIAHRQTAAPQVLDLNETIAATLSMLRRLIGGPIELTWEPAADLCPVKIDPTHVGQILTNLCLNARDAIAGAGRITVRTEDCIVSEADGLALPGVPPGHYAMLSVSDTGCGMAAEALQHVFEPFYTTKGMAGTGLGLATVHGVVTQNHGGIDVTSAPGRGTTFRIYLPRAAAPVARAPAVASAPTPRPRGGGTILLVEDDEAARLACQRMLTCLGYSVLVAAGPEAALAAAEQHPGKLDLLLTDVVMPGMPPDEMARRIQRLRPGLPCLYMSGYPDDVVNQRGILCTNGNFINKPFSMEEIAAKLRETLA